MGKMTLSLSSRWYFVIFISFLENIRRLRRGEKEARERLDFSLMYKKRKKEKNERDAV